MTIRREMRGLLVAWTAVMAATIAAMVLYCFSRGSLSIHLATLAILTTSGPLVARVFEGWVRRRQRIRDLDMNCLAADDEVMFSRTVPLLMPIAGAMFSYFVMM
ncbi:MAG: hypothetical protein H0T41_09280 [Rhodobacteraceae bacterium]|nr:hypothetical protein [Paracoccaceae bacterium]